MICCTCRPNPDPQGNAWYFAATSDPLDVLLQPDIRAALDWLLAVDTPAADAILKLISAVERGDTSAIPKLLTAIARAIDRYDRRPGRSS